MPQNSSWNPRGWVKTTKMKWRHNHMQWPRWRVAWETLPSDPAVCVCVLSLMAWQRNAIQCMAHRMAHRIPMCRSSSIRCSSHRSSCCFCNFWILPHFSSFTNAMPQSCVVGGCSRNTSKNPGVCFLSFPKNESTRRSWIRFVNNTRSDFVLTDWSN